MGTKLKKNTNGDNSTRTLHFTNYNAKTVGLDIPLTVKVLQPGRKVSHSPRVQFFSKELGYRNTFAVDINEPSLIFGNWERLTNIETLIKIQNHIRENKEMYLAFWNDRYLTLYEYLESKEKK